MAGVDEIDKDLVETAQSKATYEGVLGAGVDRRRVRREPRKPTTEDYNHSFVRIAHRYRSAGLGEEDLVRRYIEFSLSDDKQTLIAAKFPTIEHAMMNVTLQGPFPALAQRPAAILLHARIDKAAPSSTARGRRRSSFMRVLFMVDPTGRTEDCFLDTGLVKALGLTVGEVPGMHVKGSDGSFLVFDGRCSAVAATLDNSGKVQLVQDFLVLPFAANGAGAKFNGLLGAKWMRTLGPVVFDLMKSKMAFMAGWGEVRVIHGSPSTGPAPVFTVGNVARPSDAS